VVTDTDGRTHVAIDAVFRIESAKLIAGLARLVGDVGLAEDLAQDALVAALERWPVSGVPDNPAAWLMATARHRAIDRIRRDKMLERKHGQLTYELEAQQERAVPDLDAALDDHVGDDLLRLVFTTCHPMLATEARVALTLRLLGGLTTAEIARAFLVPEPTIAQRIVRAKRMLSEARVAFEVPRGDEFVARLGSVLQVIYLVFNEGYSATAGDDWLRPALCEDALRLGRILATLAPAEPEVHGLVALMEIQASRAAARVTPTGEPAIGRGLAALARADSLGGALGPYALQAAIAACHARARRADDTDWVRIAALYGALAERVPSPVVELNRAVAVGMASGPAAGLELVDRLAGEPALASSPAAKRPRRPARETWPSRRRACRVRTRRVTHAQFARARAAAAPRKAGRVNGQALKRVESSSAAVAVHQVDELVVHRVGLDRPSPDRRRRTVPQVVAHQLATNRA
jgi:RNA polymerase sigma factor (sigma-70 family)